MGTRESDGRDAGDIVTTHLMPETTLEEKMDQAELRSLRLQVEELEKRNASLNQDVERYKKLHSLAEKSLDSLGKELTETKTELSVARDLIQAYVASENDLRISYKGKIEELEDKVTCLTSQLEMSDETMADDAALIADFAKRLGEVNKHYNNKPVFLHNWQTSIADWLSGNAIERTRKWFIDLYGILK